MYVPVLLGTARTGRRSEAVARLVLERLQATEVTTELVDVADFGYSRTEQGAGSPEIRTFATLVVRADALIVVSPEYNHGYPGELKILLDHLDEEWRGKRVGLCMVSEGPWGGARGGELLMHYFTVMGGYPHFKPVYVPNAGDLQQNGRIVDDALIRRVDTLIRSLITPPV